MLRSKTLCLQTITGISKNLVVRHYFKQKRYVALASRSRASMSMFYV